MGNNVALANQIDSTPQNGVDFFKSEADSSPSTSDDGSPKLYPFFQHQMDVYVDGLHEKDLDDFKSTKDIE
ncbi:unnamed protein product [Moneuplotes crassus]|uniref:Uncharacterized protein n=1 Tax=Euplotes crassus TaxID=5936 RepID=A0AAD1XDB4_EUPCR|nr:unnamed protein product [Moneuplotes crassus]